MKSTLPLCLVLAFCALSPVLAQTNHFWGFPGAKAVPGDYDGDGCADLAIFSRDSADWFNNNIVAADYSMTNGVWGGAVPWTRLGYTYDWALPSYKTVGLSEFIIPGKMLWDTEGIEVTVEVTMVTNALYYAGQ